MEGNLVDRIIPPRAAATQAIASFSELTEGSDDEGSPRLQAKVSHSHRGKGRTPLKPKSSITRPLPVRATGSKFSPSTSAHEPVKPRRVPRPLTEKPKQPVTPPAIRSSNVRGSDSDLTPASSPICSPILNPKLLERPLETPKRVQSLKRRVGSTSTPSTPLLWPPPPAESWDVSKLGTYVWVLLDARARILEPGEPTDFNEQTKERLWWPGKVKSPSTNIPLTNIPLKVRLFGDAYPGVKTIEIREPCHMNILSLEDSAQRARFEHPTFVPASSFTENMEGSPRKKQKHDRGDQEDRWGVAVAQLLHEKEDDQGSDVMPEVGTLGFAAYVSSAPISSASPAKSVKGTPRTKRAGRGNAKSASDMEDEFEMEISDFKREEDRWSPPSADDSLEIPGELLFARDRQSSTIYWPARILEYLPPKKRTQEGKYRLEFLDNMVLDIPRKLFFISEEDGFTTCKLGKWESATCDILNDDDEEEDTIDTQRSASPVPLDPPPHPGQFIHLDIREQFVYTKSVLKALLNGRYAPAKRQHDLFVGGGLGRKSVCEDAGLRGRMDPRDVAQLQKHLIEWCLRDEKRAKRFADENDVAEPEGWSPTDDPAIGNGFEEDLPVSNVRGRSPSPSVTDVASSHDLPPDSFWASEEAELPPMSSQASDARVDSPLHTLSNSSQEITKVNTDDRPGSTRLEPEQDIAFPRQQGCEAYEALAGVEKIDYCVNVLLPEAILQILLWRSGYRTSVELLSEEEEQELHEKGEELRKERDWVYDVMRLRKLKLKQMQGMSQTVGGTNGKKTRETASGRPKRNVAMPKSYLE